MRYRQLGRCGLRVSEVALGSWLTFGRSVDQETSNRCVREAFDQGVIFFDTADIYARGQGEIAMGKALADLPRPEYVLATKAYWPMSDNPNDRGLSRKHLVESCDASLRRLGVEYIDLYQCHRYDPDTPVEEVVRAMETLIRQGKILYWGVSVWSGAEIEAACGHADRFSAFRPISNQPSYSLLDRDIESGVIPACERLGVGQVVFSPLAEGVLTGKYQGGAIPEDSRAADPKAGKFVTPFLTDKKLARVEKLVAIAGRLDLEPGTLALAWCLRQLNVASVIVGATKVEHVTANARAGSIDVPAETLSELDEIFAPGDDA